MSYKRRLTAASSRTGPAFSTPENQRRQNGQYRGGSFRTAGEIHGRASACFRRRWDTNETRGRIGDPGLAPGSIIDRMERLPSDPHIDNPLKITNDARKAGLDFRLIDPTAPDFKGS